MLIDKDENTGKAILQMSREEWKKIGKEMGWDKLCQKTRLNKKQGLNKKEAIKQLRDLGFNEQATAIRNMHTDKLKNAKNIYQYVMFSFNWNSSPQGYDYWYNFAGNLCRKIAVEN